MTELIRCTMYNGLYVYTYNISIYHILFMRNIYIYVRIHICIIRIYLWASHLLTSKERMMIITGLEVKSRGGMGTCVQRYSPGQAF